MAVFLLDFLFRMFTWGIVALGLALAFHALFTDQIAGLIRRHKVRRGLAAPRLRCPGGFHRVLAILPLRQGCWYDMSGATADPDDPGGRLLCPECGRRSGPKRLRRSKRRYRLAVAGAGVMVVGLAGLYARLLYHYRLSVVPDAVLVLVPFDERAWLENGVAGGHPLLAEAGKQITIRHAAGSLSPWAATHIGRRVQRRYERDPDYGVDDASRAAFAKLESTPFTAGIEGRPFSEAVATIGAVAGVELTLDRAALEAVSIEPDRRITIPAFGSMTCEMALDWVCDRARAGRGWGAGAWTLEDGRVVVTDRASVYAAPRMLVLRAPAELRGHLDEFESTMFRSAWRNAWPVSHTVGDVMVIGFSAVDALVAERVLSIVERAEGLKWRARDDVSAMDNRLREARITPVGGDDTLDGVLHRIRSEVGVRVGVDVWGMNVYQTLREALTERGVIDVDRTAHDADPFGGDAEEVEVEAIETAWAALSSFPVEAAHDGQSVLIGLRGDGLVSLHRAYRLPARPPHAVGSGGRNALFSEAEFAWFDRVAEVAGRIDPSWNTTGRVQIVGDRLVVVGPINVQVRAAEVIEEFLAERGG